MLHYCTYPSVKEAIENTFKLWAYSKTTWNVTGQTSCLPLKADQSDCNRLLSQLATATGFLLVATLGVQHCLVKSSSALQCLTKLLTKNSQEKLVVSFFVPKKMSSSIVKTVAMATSTPAAARLAVASSSVLLLWFLKAACKSRFLLSVFITTERTSETLQTGGLQVGYVSFRTLTLVNIGYICHDHGAELS